MCNPLAMMGASLYQTHQKSEIASAQREQTRNSYFRAANAEGVRQDQEAIAIRMESDKISREVGRSASTTSTEMAAAGVNIPALLSQWSNIESERQGSLTAKERMMSMAGDMRMQELVARRDQRLAAQAGPGTMDYLMAGAMGFMQGQLIQQKLSANTDISGQPILDPDSDLTLGERTEYMISQFLEFGWLNPFDG